MFLNLALTLLSVASHAVADESLEFGGLTPFLNFAERRRKYRKRSQACAVQGQAKTTDIETITFKN